MLHSPVRCAAAADAYAECYPSYYDHGTVLEDSDEEGSSESEPKKKRGKDKKHKEDSDVAPSECSAFK